MNDSRNPSKPNEEVVLVDEHDRRVGTAEKLEAHRSGKLHRALSVFVFDRDGRLLIHQRAAEKYHSGGLWSNTCCSHPRPGEEVADAARRRLGEEMGLEDVHLEEWFTFTYRARVGPELWEHELDHVFVGLSDHDPEPSPEEVADWRWVTLAELAEEVEAHPDRFTYWFRELLPKVQAEARSRE